MKTVFQYIREIAMGTGLLCFLLRLILQLLGPDDKGLWADTHPLWILTLVLLAALTVLVWLFTRSTDRKRPYGENFPIPKLHSLGLALCGIGIFLSAIHQWRADLGILSLVLGIVGLAAGALVCLGAVTLYQGKKPWIYTYGIMSLYFVLHLIISIWTLYSEPEVYTYLLRFLASTALVLAAVQRWGFDMAMSDRRKSLYWSLLAGALCFAASAGDPELLFFWAAGLWCFLDCCTTVPRKPREEEAEK